ncbi:VOC family protein [Hymenobacter sp. ISL-91]|uniref:VOC family protein n=1 Tax=Hymenobacter sp. ISL-91 TaxID=2819151 RepID=UPI001BEA3585|nr:VOC family protein [Hymenobacter sp. ISL-91]MBT2558901.1 VOC family protein [Hymenobacter sp. ISL-91]
MKTPLWISLLLLLLWPVLAQAQDNPTPGFSAQKTLVYPVSSAERLPAAIAWYTDFFGKPPTRVVQDAEHPYALFNIDGAEVRLETDPQFLQLREPVFYWTLPTPEDVVAKFERLSANRANKFNGGLFSKLRQLDSTRSSSSEVRPAAGNTGPEGVTQVRGFIVLDPEGNQIGVINNPVYPPK